GLFDAVTVEAAGAENRQRLLFKVGRLLLDLRGNRIDLIRRRSGLDPFLHGLDLRVRQGEIKGGRRHRAGNHFLIEKAFFGRAFGYYRTLMTALHYGEIGRASCREKCRSRWRW